MISGAGGGARRGQDAALVKVRDLKTYYPIERGVLGRTVGWVKAVDGVRFDVPRGGTLGLVGESGCGKTTVGRTILRLQRATGGSVLFDGLELFALPARTLRAVRRDMQIVFQDPAGSLNPRLTVEGIVGEPLRVHGVASGGELRERVGALLERVGLSADDMRRYPHAFSGGQRQRIGIARAIALQPKFIVCDEPVSALDVSIQSQILNLLAELQADLGLSYLFIAHDLAVVRFLSDLVAVMYLGRIVEHGPVEAVFSGARHPYTKGLLAAAPRVGAARRGGGAVLAGEAASAAAVPSGCAFHPRCPFATEECRRYVPALEQKRGMAGGHMVACHEAHRELSMGDS